MKLAYDFSSQAIRAMVLALLLPVVSSGAFAGENVFSAKEDQVLFNGTSFKVIGLRTSNALVSDAATRQLIDHLDLFKSYGVNTVSVYFMGSRYGDVKGYRPDASLDPVYAARMGRIIEAADARGMIVLVGCLYWSTSRANEALSHWTQTEANRAVANTVAWLSAHNYRNVFVDPDNEGMARAAKGWCIAEMIDAAHAQDRSIMVAYNDRPNPPPENADLYVHHSSKVPGKPWIETEGSAPNTPRGGYWGDYSKESHHATGYYNYSRIGRYTAGMKSAQISSSRRDIDRFNGYVMASTWLQCGPLEGIGGPIHAPGGRSEIADVDQERDVLHPDAGILWWLEAIRDAYGPWTPPPRTSPAPGRLVP
jgi:hypothetical protein